MTTYLRCKGCRAFFDKALPACSECGVEKNAVNKWLVTSKLNNALYEQAARASK